MRIFVVSDTHGNLRNAIALYDKIAANAPVDCIIHCGDYRSDGVKLAKIYGQPVYAVHGNCDGGWGEEEFEIAQTPAEELQFSKQLGLPDPVDPVLIDPLGDVS